MKIKKLNDLLAQYKIKPRKQITPNWSVDYYQESIYMFRFTAYGGRFGHINKYNGGLCFYGCRDKYHNDLEDLGIDDIIFTTRFPDKSERFIHRVERKLGLKKPSEFFLIKHEGVSSKIPIVFIKPNRFWHGHLIRFSLFTILLRGSRHYKNSINDVIDNDRYLKDSKDCVQKFLKGYVNFNLNIKKYKHEHKHEQHGWANVMTYFRSELMLHVEEILVKRKPKNPTLSISHIGEYFSHIGEYL